MARLTKREILVFVISVTVLAPLVVRGVLFLLGLLFDEPDPPKHAAGTDSLGTLGNVAELITSCLPGAGGAEGGAVMMDEQTKTEIWDLAVGTFIAVAVVSIIAFAIFGQIHW
jgi:hypothetical protein